MKATENHTQTMAGRIRIAAIAATLVTAFAVWPGAAGAAQAAAPPEFTDTFDGARDAAPTYGINDAISTRQSGPGKGVTYTRLPGDFSAPTTSPPAYTTQVGANAFPGKLSFWARNSAIRLDSPAMTDANDSYTVTATVDPNASALGSDEDWVSIMLSRSSGANGYVTNSAVDAGLAVRRDGRFMLYQRGTPLWTSEAQATRASSGFAVSLTVTAAHTTTPSLMITVNGVTKTTTLGGALAQPYVSLGAFLSNGSASTQMGEVSTVDNLTVSRVAQYVDDFNGANVNAGDYGLNQNLASRQNGLPIALTYSRVSGTPTGAASDPTYSQVNNPSFTNALSFWVRNSAVRMDSPVSADSAGAFEIRATVRPDPGKFGTTDDWVSLMLSTKRDARGYVTDTDLGFSMTVTRMGTVALYRGGTLIGSTFTVPTSTTGYDVSIQASAARSSSPSVTVTVNGVSRTVSLTAALAKPYLYMGAYISNGSATTLKEVSTVDNLTISRIDQFPTLQRFGTYGTYNDSVAGNHIGDMAGIANVHWINILPTKNADPMSITTSVLASCPVNSCILYVGNAFFKPETPQVAYPDTSRWTALVQALQPYKDRIAGYYLQDEAYMYGVTYQQLNWSAQTVRSSINSGSIPAAPIMFNMIWQDLVNSVAVPPDVDWLGMDNYEMRSADMDWAITRMEQMANDPSKRIFLFPPNVPDGWNMWHTEGEIRVLQNEYLQAANRHPRVAALLNFGLWVNTGAANSAPRQQTYVPSVFDLQERVGAVIMSRP